MPFDSVNPEPYDRVLDVLRGARSLIDDPAHWTQRTYEGRGGSVCSQAAIIKASGESIGLWMMKGGGLNSGAEGAHRCLEMAIIAATQGAFHLVIPFNDAPGRTHAEVLSVFDHAIEIRLHELRLGNPAMAAALPPREPLPVSAGGFTDRYNAPVASKALKVVLASGLIPGSIAYNFYSQVFEGPAVIGIDKADDRVLELVG